MEEKMELLSAYGIGNCIVATIGVHSSRPTHSPQMRIGIGVDGLGLGSYSLEVLGLSV